MNYFVMYFVFIINNSSQHSSQFILGVLQYLIKIFLQKFVPLIYFRWCLQCMIKYIQRFLQNVTNLWIFLQNCGNLFTVSHNFSSWFFKNCYSNRSCNFSRFTIFFSEEISKRSSLKVRQEIPSRISHVLNYKKHLQR